MVAVVCIPEVCNIECEIGVLTYLAILLLSVLFICIALVLLYILILKYLRIWDRFHEYRWLLEKTRYVKSLSFRRKLLD